MKQVLQENGIVGAGGAGFPTYAKLDERAEVILMNCAECEPLLKLHRQLLEQRAEEILRTFDGIARTVGAQEAVIGIKREYKAAVKAIETYIDAYPNMRIQLLDSVYPMGDEVVLIYEATGRVIRPGGLPIEEGVAVFNVETVYNAYRALERQTPVFDKLVSVVGEVERPVTLRVPIGASIGDTVAYAGGITAKEPAYLVGGPMMGIALQSLDAPVTKDVNSLVCLTGWEHKPDTPAGVCIRCGKCVAACPMHLAPTIIRRALEDRDLTRLSKYHLEDCNACGCCSFICPAQIPLVETVAQAAGLVKRGEVEQ